MEEFIQTKSAWVSQVTLYSYLKTRMGTRYVLHFDNDEFMKSVNEAKWNIYSVALQDLTFFTFFYLKVNSSLPNRSSNFGPGADLLMNSKKISKSPGGSSSSKSNIELNELKSLESELVSKEAELSENAKKFINSIQSWGDNKKIEMMKQICQM